MPQRLEDGVQQELDLDASLRKAVAEAGEQLAALLQQKEQLQARNSKCEARSKELQGDIASLQVAFTKLEADKVSATDRMCF